MCVFIQMKSEYLKLVQKSFCSFSFSLSSGIVNTWLKKLTDTIFSSPSKTTLLTLETK